MATKTSDKSIPNLENATPGFLVDEIGRIRVETARLKFLDGVYKQALEARLSPEELSGDKLIEGTNYLGSRSKRVQERINTDAVKAHFENDPEGLKKVMKLIEFWQLDTKVKVTEV